MLCCFLRKPHAKIKLIFGPSPSVHMAGHLKPCRGHHWLLLIVTPSCKLVNALLHDYLTLSNKKAELSQRWPRDAPYIRVPWTFSRVPDYAHAYFSPNFNGLLFRSILWMGVQNLEFVALPVPEIIGVPQKIGQSLNSLKRQFLQNF